MRRIIVTEENKDSFVYADTHASSILRKINMLLHDKDLELVIGDEGGSSDFLLRIDKCKVDEEYDKDRTHIVLCGRGKSLSGRFKI